MKSSFLTFPFLIIITFSSAAQIKNIVEIIDDLTLRWDETAITVKTYQGMKKVCHDAVYRYETRALLKDIHHYDSVLYNIVVSKFDSDGDREAKKTIDDIILLEKKYTTKSFLRFLHTDCGRVNEIENNFAKEGGKHYEKEQSILEKELAKYVTAITKQIDIVDRHVHHLKGL